MMAEIGNRYAYPVLKQYGFHATAFIISSRIKRHPQKWDPKSLQFMSISELRQIQDVFDIQSHTHFLHRVDASRRPILFSRSYHNILFDFARSRRALASLIRTCSTFPIPSAAITPRRCRRRMTPGFIWR
jgi:peptidoglycan/xylan/chitin deacetylase (PgdA/CDA1 family)